MEEDLYQNEESAFKLFVSILSRNTSPHWNMFYNRICLGLAKRNTYSILSAWVHTFIVASDRIPSLLLWAMTCKCKEPEILALLESDTFQWDPNCSNLNIVKAVWNERHIRTPLDLLRGAIDPHKTSYTRRLMLIMLSTLEPDLFEDDVELLDTILYRKELTHETKYLREIILLFTLDGLCDINTLRWISQMTSTIDVNQLVPVPSPPRRISAAVVAFSDITAVVQAMFKKSRMLCHIHAALNATVMITYRNRSFRPRHVHPKALVDLIYKHGLVGLLPISVAGYGSICDNVFEWISKLVVDNKEIVGFHVKSSILYIVALVSGIHQQQMSKCGIDPFLVATFARTQEEAKYILANTTNEVDGDFFLHRCIPIPVHETWMHLLPVLGPWFILHLNIHHRWFKHTGVLTEEGTLKKEVLDKIPKCSLGTLLKKNVPEKHQALVLCLLIHQYKNEPNTLACFLKKPLFKNTPRILDSDNSVIQRSSMHHRDLGDVVIIMCNQLNIKMVNTPTSRANSRLKHVQLPTVWISL